ncbi:MarR family winged helix-turn-helix transcriptional regulator [Niveispirillum fermenti]|uniref:MarR family winged helix-turn-helix transcriptional regulator n=1 Tax=Niveispirillum fermenti TaxID=1233113 RepID=UPI003A8BA2A1
MFDRLSEPVANRLADGFVRIAAALKANEWRDATPHGLTATQARILSLLRENPEGLRPVAIAARLGVKAPTASEATTTLVHKGLVLRTAAPDDGRGHLVLASPAGLALADRFGGGPLFLIDTLAGLPAADQLALLRVMLRLIHGLQGEGHISITRMCLNCKYFQPNLHPDSEQPHHCRFVDAPLGDRHLRLDCPEQIPAPPDVAQQVWADFLNDHGGAR